MKRKKEHGEITEGMEKFLYSLSYSFSSCYPAAILWEKYSFKIPVKNG